MKPLPRGKIASRRFDLIDVTTMGDSERVYVEGLPMSAPSRFQFLPDCQGCGAPALSREPSCPYCKRPR